MRRVHLIVIKNSYFTWQVYGFLHSRVGYYLSKYIGNIYQEDFLWQFKKYKECVR